MSTNVLRTWSIQQESIFDFTVNSNGHLVVRARAGTGKTTTIVEAVKRWLAANPGKTAILCAFNKTIAAELQSRFAGHTNVEVKTLHAIGYACCRRFRDNLKVEFGKARADALAARVCGKSAPDTIVRMVSKLHTLGREIAPHATKLGDLTAIAIQHECEPDEVWERAGFGAEYVETRALQAMELAADVKSGDTIDGSDMIFLPVRNGWLVKQWDLVVVDEMQDMTVAQLEIALGSVNDGGRVIGVGDDRQAIYGFRGADSGSLDRIKGELVAAELGLTVTYRCGRSIVEIACGWVPDFEAGPNNPEGAVSTIAAEKLVAAAGPGDFILSRVNAPLVATAMSLLRAGKRARVAGRDIGKGLTTLLLRMKAKSVPDLMAKIETWENREVTRQEAKMSATTNGKREAIKAKIEAIRDQAAMLTNLADGAKNVQEVLDRAEALFSDDGLGAAGVITCSSVHKAKGLEADRVFILRSTLRETSVEEQNICYVAVTRAKKELVWVEAA